MRLSMVRRGALTLAIAAALALPGQAGVAVAAAGDPGAAKVKHSKVRMIRGGDGVVTLRGAATLGPSSYYWYRPTVVRHEKVYLLSSEAQPAPGWFCCLMLGIAY